MTGGYQVYSEYKDSGIGWMGEVPVNWMVHPCRAAVRNIANKNEGAQDQNYLSLMANVGVIRYEDKGDVGNKKPDDLSKCKIVKKGNLVINSMNYAIGSYGMSSYDGVCSPVYIVLDAKKDVIKQRFALRIFENKPFQKYLATFGNGILEHRAAIGWDDIKGAYIPLPSAEEQLTILNFLDHETAKIDALIEKQQQLIKLLKEKRKAVINHAVTKGLNPDVKMRDSGVTWFKVIPEHWKVGKLGYYSKISNGATPSRDNMDYWDGGSIGWLNSSKVNDICITKAEQFITKLALNQTSVQKVCKNDLVIAITGEGQTRGRVAICLINATINQHLASISIIDPTLSRNFLFYWLQSQYERIRHESSGAGSTKGAITCRDIVSYPLPIPPVSEQHKAVKFIKKVDKKFNALITNSKEQVNLLIERRTAIISAAVTGKIDVRDWKAPAKNNKREDAI
jgi:type I restriction enzyme S subunit